MEGSAPGPKVLCFGRFELDRGRGELRRAGSLVRLQPQPFKILTLLASRAGQTISRDEIRRHVWSEGTFVDFEHGLNSCIRQIRQALGDSTDAPVFVQTVPRHGYRFIALVEERHVVPGKRIPAQTAPLGSLGIRIAASVVLLLLAAITFSWHGSTQRETPQGPAKSAFARVANPSRKSNEAYLKGRYFWNKRTREGVSKGVVYFREAIQEDPRFAPAYAALADSYNILGDYGWLPAKEAYSAAKDAAYQALAVDNQLAGAYAALGKTAHHYDWDWAAAERSFRQAIALDPNYAPGHQWYAEFLAAMGRHEEAIEEMQKALNLDPLSLIINTNMGWMYYFAERYDEAIQQFQATLAMDPAFPGAHHKLGLTYLQQGRLLDAIREFERADHLAGLVFSYARMGDRRRAIAILQEMTSPLRSMHEPSYCVALAYLGLGEKEKAMVELKKGYEERGSLMAYLGVDPSLGGLRSAPGFEDLLLRMKLPATHSEPTPATQAAAFRSFANSQQGSPIPAGVRGELQRQ